MWNDSKYSCISIKYAQASLELFPEICILKVSIYGISHYVIVSCGLSHNYHSFLNNSDFEIKGHLESSSFRTIFMSPGLCIISSRVSFISVSDAASPLNNSKIKILHDTLSSLEKQLSEFVLKWQGEQDTGTGQVCFRLAA